METKEQAAMENRTIKGITDELVKVGDKIRFQEEKAAYTVKAINNDYIIATKPYNPQRTVIYTILDRKNNVRSSHDSYKGYDLKTEEGSLELLKDLASGFCKLSRRNTISLNICDLIPQ